MTLHILCTSFQRPIQQRILIDSLIVQTKPFWKLYIIHDGPAPMQLRHIVNEYEDLRIKYFETETVVGQWGHPNKKKLLDMIPRNHSDFVLMTNDDNYYVPKFVEMMTRRCGSFARKIGMVYCDTAHSYTQYDVLKTQLKENLVDMGSFIVRVDIAKKIGFDASHFSADGAYAEACANLCKRLRLEMIYIPKVLFIHN